MDALNALNAVKLEHGGAMNGQSEHSEHSEYCEVGTWWCYEWTL